MARPGEGEECGAAVWFAPTRSRVPQQIARAAHSRRGVAAESFRRRQRPFPAESCVAATIRRSLNHIPKFLLALCCGTARTYDQVSRTIVASWAQGMETAQHDSAKWWTRWRLTRDASRAEAQVALWKAAWLRGATAVWQHQNTATSPYDSEMQRAAWHAGAKWAGENPDRRTNRAPRFAHPRRRASDLRLPATIKRAVAVGATSLALYAVSKAFRWGKRTPSP